MQSIRDIGLGQLSDIVFFNDIWKKLSIDENIKKNSFISSINKNDVLVIQVNNATIGQEITLNSNYILDEIQKVSNRRFTNLRVYCKY